MNSKAFLTSIINGVQEDPRDAGRTPHKREFQRVNNRLYCDISWILAVSSRICTEKALQFFYNGIISEPFAFKYDRMLEDAAV